MNGRASATSRRVRMGPDRAVIDIGSNTVRLVIFTGAPRAPQIWLNEKVTARLGRGVAETGRMHETSVDLALGEIARFARILSDLNVPEIQTVATAAVRDATNGGEFLAEVAKLGLEPRLLSGEEEARASAAGVIGAFPAARGVVADLGGGSLELVSIENNESHHGVSLPLGTLRLPGLRGNDARSFKRKVEKELKAAGWAQAHEGPLYMVGGTWRAMAAFAMQKLGYPLTDPHGLVLSTEDADKLAKKISRTDPGELAKLNGISSSRSGALPDAASLLRIMLADLRPDGLVFSAWGIREGLLFQELDGAAQAQNPLLAGVGHFTEPQGITANAAAMVAGWTAGATAGTLQGVERLRLAATMLALAVAHLEPNLRARHAYDWAMDKRWISLAPRERALLAAALVASCGNPQWPEQLSVLASEEDLREAAAWGLAVRLCRRIGAGSRLSLLTSKLRQEEDRYVLWFDQSHGELVSEHVRADLKLLANWRGKGFDIEVG